MDFTRSNLSYVDHTHQVSYPIASIMFHTKEQCVIIIANGWPADGVDITHAASVSNKYVSHQGAMCSDCNQQMDGTADGVDITHGSGSETTQYKDFNNNKL